jgi:hypothetical protein
MAYIRIFVHSEPRRIVEPWGWRGVGCYGASRRGGMAPRLRVQEP